MSFIIRIFSNLKTFVQLKYFYCFFVPLPLGLGIELFKPVSLACFKLSFAVHHSRFSTLLLILFPSLWFIWGKLSGLRIKAQLFNSINVFFYVQIVTENIMKITKHWDTRITPINILGLYTRLWYNSSVNYPVKSGLVSLCKYYTTSPYKEFCTHYINLQRFNV